LRRLETISRLRTTLEKLDDEELGEFLESFGPFPYLR
jgi:hypothetical protein